MHPVTNPQNHAKLSQSAVAHLPKFETCCLTLHIEPIEAPEEETTAVPVADSARPSRASDELTERQRAVLAALRAKMGADNLVAAKAVVLAEAAGIPLGSLHSVLQSLEKKAGDPHGAQRICESSRRLPGLVKYLGVDRT